MLGRIRRPLNTMTLSVVLKLIQKSRAAQCSTPVWSGSGSGRPVEASGRQGRKIFAQRWPDRQHVSLGEIARNRVSAKKVGKTWTAIVGVMVVFAMIGAAFVTFLSDMFDIAGLNSLSLDVLGLRHRRNQERASDKRRGYEPNGRKEGRKRHDR